VQRIILRRVAERGPLLHEIDAQDRLHGERRPPLPSFIPARTTMQSPPQRAPGHCACNYCHELPSAFARSEGAGLVQIASRFVIVAAKSRFGKESRQKVMRTFPKKTDCCQPRQLRAVSPSTMGPPALRSEPDLAPSWVYDSSSLHVPSSWRQAHPSPAPKSFSL
jgi:hypothetical protein